MRPALAGLSILAFSLLLPAGAGAAPPALVLYDGTPRAGVEIKAVAPDSEHALAGDRASAQAALAKAFPDSAIELTRARAPDGRSALTLDWRGIWKSGVQLQAAGSDLRPYLNGGALAFDLKVEALKKGGIVFKVGCGDDCERQVSYVVPGRAAEGQGWRRIVLPMSCFARDGDDFSKVDRPFTLEGTGSGRVSIANVAFSASDTPNTACPDWRTVSVTPAMLDESWSIDWWLPRHRQKLDDARRMVAAGRSPQLVFIGDSITHGWEKEGKKVWQRYYAGYNALGLGFGGDRTENVLWRLQNGALDGLDPKLAVLMIGTNNAGLRGDFASSTVAGIRRDVEEIQARLPKTRILVLAIFPRDAAADGALRRLNEQVNARLPALADGRRVFFLNLNQSFLAPDGRLSTAIMPDLLHPNAAGYAIWARAMQPELKRLMALPRL